MVDKEKDQPRTPIGADLIIPLLASAFTIYYVTTIWELPWAAKANGLFLGVTLLLLVALFLFFTVRSLIRGEVSLSFAPLFTPIEFLARRLGLTVLMISFIAAILYLGFTLTIFLFLVVAMWVLGVRSVKQLIGVAGVSALVGYLLFIAVLNTPFPRGPVEALLGSIF